MLHRIVAVVGALAVTAGASGPASAETLFDALAAAYTNNPTLLSERANVRVTDEQVPQALSNWRPSVAMDAEAGTAASQNNTSADQRQHRDPRSIELSVTQPLFRGGRTVAATKEAGVPGEPGSLWALSAVGATWITYFAALYLNFCDFSRYARDKAAVRTGNLWGLPVNLILFSLVAGVTTIAAYDVYGEVLLHPEQISAKFESWNGSK